jgi:hypothetical protein
MNRFIHSKMQNYVSLCLKIAPEGEKNFEKRSLFTQNTLCPPKNAPKWEENTPSQTLGWAGLILMLFNFKCIMFFYTSTRFQKHKNLSVLV